MDIICETCKREAIEHDEVDFPCKWTEADVVRQHHRNEDIANAKHIVEQELSNEKLRDEIDLLKKNKNAMLNLFQWIIDDGLGGHYRADIQEILTQESGKK